MTSSADRQLKKSGEQKRDFIIATWENLDCESVGTEELLAIEASLKAEFGADEAFLPMRIARLLADEGAELRHAEIMQLFVERFPQSAQPSDLSALFRFDTLPAALNSIRSLELKRREFLANCDDAGLGQLRSRVAECRRQIKEQATKGDNSGADPAILPEIADWLAVWLETPEMFETWLAIRRKSPDFIKKFG